MPDLNGFKSYAQIMPDVPDENIKIYYEAAISQAKNSGVDERLFAGDGHSLLSLYIYAMATHFYDNRTFSMENFNQRAASKMLFELKHAAEVMNEKA